MSDSSSSEQQEREIRMTGTMPECKGCGCGMIMATKEQFANRICGTCERSGTPTDSGEATAAPDLAERFALKESIYRLRCEMDTGSPAEAHGWSLNLVRSSDIAAVLNEIDRLMLTNGQIAKLWADAEDRASSPPPAEPEKNCKHCGSDIENHVGTFSQCPDGAATFERGAPPAELSELLDTIRDSTASRQSRTDARDQILSLFQRQQEEAERRFQSMMDAHRANGELATDYLRLQAENERLREQQPFSVEELAELCSVTGDQRQVRVNESLRAKLVQMWNEANRRRLSSSREPTE